MIHSGNIFQVKPVMLWTELTLCLAWRYGCWTVGWRSLGAPIICTMHGDVQSMCQCSQYDIGVTKICYTPSWNVCMHSSVCYFSYDKLIKVSSAWQIPYSILYSSTEQVNSRELRNWTQKLNSSVLVNSLIFTFKMTPVPGVGAHNLEDTSSLRRYLL